MDRYVQLPLIANLVWMRALATLTARERGVHAHRRVRQLLNVHSTKHKRKAVMAPHVRSQLLARPVMVLAL
jgi:hypothetical protein